MNQYLETIIEKADQSKYTRWYVGLMNKAISRALENCDVERHHIMPKSLLRFVNLKDGKSNLVTLTLKEHLIAHRLLSKMFESNYNFKIRMGCALSMFAKYNLRGTRSILKGNMNPMFGPITPQRRANVSKAKKGKTVGTDNHFFGKKHTTETKEKMSKPRQSKTFNLAMRKISLKRGNSRVYKITDKKGYSCVLYFSEFCLKEGISQENARGSVYGVGRYKQWTFEQISPNSDVPIESYMWLESEPLLCENPITNKSTANYVLRHEFDHRNTFDI